MKVDFAFHQPEWLERVDSTNDELKRRLRDQSLPSGCVLAADIQTRGKGRLGRTWVSSAGAGLLFSFVWQGTVPVEQAGTLPMACALGVGDFLSKHAIASQCKWPNDVMTPLGKICGILTESVSGTDGSTTLCIGIGINVRTDPGRDKAIEQAVACLEQFDPAIPSPRTILPDVLHCLEQRIARWNRGGFSAIRDDFSASLWGKGETVTVRTGKGTVSGTIAGLDNSGALLLRVDDGNIVPVVSAAALDS